MVVNECMYLKSNICAELLNILLSAISDFNDLKERKGKH